MGRQAMKMALIEKQKTRNKTFKSRKETLTKKLDELATLCGVPACMIVVDPATNAASVSREDSGDLRRLIAAYNARDREEDGRRLFNLSDFFKERQRKAEADLGKLKRENLKAKFPIWDDSLAFMDESQLRGLAAALRDKAAAVRSRIAFLQNSRFYNAPDFYHAPPPPPLLLPPPPPAAVEEGYMGQFCGFGVDGMNNGAAAEIPASLPEYYYAPPLPAAAEPYVFPPNYGGYYSSMDANGNGINYGDYYGDYGDYGDDDITRYLLQ